MQTLTEVYNPRNLITYEDNKIIINEDNLDLFSYPEYNAKPWKPKINLPEYSTLTALYLDIETTGLDPKTCKVVLIGLMNEAGKPYIIDCLEDEKAGLEAFLVAIRKKLPDLLVTFNGFHFDLPFLIHRLEKYKLPHPFSVDTSRVKTFRVAQKNGKPQQYNDIRVITFPKNKTTVIDLYHQLLAWDFVARKLTSHTLKQSVLQTGLRSEARLELPFSEMQEIIKSGDLTKLKEYLTYDLEDTKLLADMLIPAIWYQRLFLPDWNFQSLSTAGNGSKWNDILKKHYPLNLPETELPKRFEGGLTYAKSGLFLNVSKIDVASLYPNIMLSYGICSKKDVDNFMLSMLRYQLDFRLNLKRLKNEGLATSEQKRTEGAMKVMINSAYGFLGTTGVEFNDYEAAALVTSHGRAILKLMMSTIESLGGVLISCDTDGVYYATDDPTLEKNKYIHQQTQTVMPKNITLEYELEARGMFVPPNSDDEQLGLKKNYIIVDTKGKVKCKGRYVKRDRCKLEKDFQPNLVLKLIESRYEADKYYNAVIDSLKAENYKIEDLSITRLIRKGEKTLVELGVGKEGDVVTFYRGVDETVIGKKGKPLKNKKEIWTKDGTVGWQHYINLVTEMYQEVVRGL